MSVYNGTIRAGRIAFAAVILFAFAALTFTLAQGTTVATKRLINIKTEPNASVWLNGILYGKTDAKGVFEIKNAPAGKQAVKVRAAGFKESSKVLLPTQTGHVEFVLVKTTDEAELAFQDGERLSTVDRQRSAEAFRKAIKIKPAYIDANIGLARVLSDANDVEGAIKAVKQTVRIAPANAEAAAVEGRIYVLTGDEAKAIAAFKRAITNGGGFQPEANTGLGMIYQDRAETAGSEGDVVNEAKNYNEAARYFAVAAKQLGTAPDAPIIYQLLGVVYEKQQKYKEAIAVYENFLKLFPDSVEATAVRSFIVQLKKQMAEQ